MAAETDYIRVEDEDVLVEGATENTSIVGSPATYATLGCIEGDLTISNGVDTISVAARNWCTAGTPVLNQLRAGNRTITISFNLTMDLSDATTKSALASARSNPPATYYIRTIATDNNGTPNSLTNEYGGFFTQFDENYRQDNVAIFTCNYTVTNVLQDSVVAP